MSIGDTVVRVDPKLDDINHLMFLLGYAKRPGWSTSPVPLSAHEDFVVAVADAFARQASTAVGQGLLQGYYENEDALPVLRGRLREHEQLRRNYGVAIPLLVRYDEYSVDIAENQILATAVDRLIRVVGLRDETVKLLRRLRAGFAEVTVATRGQVLPSWRPTRLNERYQTALRLAELVIEATSFSHHAGTIRTSGFMVDMAKVFEDFVTVALSHALRPYGGVCKPQDPTYLDDVGVVRMEPDLVWRNGSNPLAVIDAKYKAEKLSGFPYADIYQLLAYCTALGLNDGDLVYAKGNELPTIHRLRNTGITIHCHTLDLAQRPDALLAQIQRLADSVASRCQDRN